MITTDELENMFLLNQDSKSNCTDTVFPDFFRAFHLATQKLLTKNLKSIQNHCSSFDITAKAGLTDWRGLKREPKRIIWGMVFGSEKNELIFVRNFAKIPALLTLSQFLLCHSVDLVNASSWKRTVFHLFSSPLCMSELLFPFPETRQSLQDQEPCKLQVRSRCPRLLLSHFRGKSGHL